MFSLMKKRNEAARQKKMDHIFQKADENGNGKITPQQMVKAYAANDVTGSFQKQKNCNYYLSRIFIVITKNGSVNIEIFIFQ